MLPLPPPAVFRDLRREFYTKGSLKGANFSGSDLTDVSLFGANLEDANFTGSNLSLANLGQANLKGANLTQVWGHACCHGMIADG